MQNMGRNQQPQIRLIIFLVFMATLSACSLNSMTGQTSDTPVSQGVLEGLIAPIYGASHESGSLACTPAKATHSHGAPNPVGPYRAVSGPDGRYTLPLPQGLFLCTAQLLKV
jgi:hypothetical protein